MEPIEAALIRATNKVDTMEHLARMAVRGLVAMAEVDVVEMKRLGSDTRASVMRRLQLLSDHQASEIADALSEIITAHRTAIVEETNRSLPFLGVKARPVDVNLQAVGIQGRGYDLWIQKAIDAAMPLLLSGGGSVHKVFSDIALSHERTLLAFNGEFLRANQADLFKAVVNGSSEFFLVENPVKLAHIDGFIYKHLNHGSGICARCAPYLNVHTTGDGTDGVPRPPLHPHCKCYLMPASFAGLGGSDDASYWIEHFEWLDQLPESRLKAVVGEHRSRLVKSGTVSIEELYFGGHLLPISALLPYARRDSAKAIMDDPVKAQIVLAFHRDYFDRLPGYLQSGGPGDVEAVMIMLSVFLSTSPIPSSGWLSALYVVLSPLPGENDQ